MTSSVDYIRCLMDHMPFDGSLSNWTQHSSANRRKRKRKEFYAKLYSVLNVMVQVRKTYIKGHFKQWLVVFFPSQIKDKLSQSLNLATNCIPILHFSHCHVGQCQWIRCDINQGKRAQSCSQTKLAIWQFWRSSEETQKRSNDRYL